MTPAAGAEKAPAKINLTLRVLCRRADGYHDIESLVAFAGVGDALTFTPGDDLALTVGGPTAAAAGDVADNLVLKAARALAERVTGETRTVHAVETFAGRGRARRRLGGRGRGVASAGAGQRACPR